jgi:hypothetical protein
LQLQLLPGARRQHPLMLMRNLSASELRLSQHESPERYFQRHARLEQKQASTEWRVGSCSDCAILCCMQVMRDPFACPAVLEKSPGVR